MTTRNVESGDSAGVVRDAGTHGAYVLKLYYDPNDNPGIGSTFVDGPNGDTLVYHLNTYPNPSSQTNRQVKYFNGEWSDNNTSDHPHGLTSGQNVQTISYSWFSSTPQFDNPYYSSGSSGGSGSIGTLSGGSSPEIKDVVFSKVTDSIVYLSFNWQNLNTAYLFVDSGGTVTQTNISLGGLGQSGSVGSSGFLTNMQDGDKVWIANTDTVAAPYIHRVVEWSYDRSTKKVVAKAFFQDNGGNGFLQNADVALGRLLGTTYSYGISLLEAQADPSNGFANHDGTLKTLTLDADPGSRWAITNIDTSQYGTSYRVPSNRTFRNFW